MVGLVVIVLVALCGSASAQSYYSPRMGGLIFNTGSPWGTSEYNRGYRGFVNAPNYVWSGTQAFHTQGRLMLGLPVTNNCNFTNYGKMRGKVVFFSFGGLCSHAHKARVVQEAGGIGAIFGQFTNVPPSFDVMAQDQDIAPLLTIPMVFVGLEVSQFITANAGPPNNTVIVTLTYQADVIYDYLHSNVGRFTIALFVVWYGLVAGWAGFKLFLFIKEQGNRLRFNVPQVCLLATVIINICMAVAISYNWLGYRNLTSQLSMVVMRDYFGILFVIPVLVFPFYWGELVGSSKPVTGLKAFAIPLFICCFIIQGFTLGVAVFKGLYGSNADVIRAQLNTIIILVGLAGCFFVFQGIRVLAALAKMQEGKLGKTSVQRRTTFLFVGLGILLFATSIYLSCYYALSAQNWSSFMALQYSYYLVTGFASTIIAFSMSPKSLKAAGGRVSAFMSGKSGTESAGQSSAATESGAVEMKDQMEDSKTPL